MSLRARMVLGIVAILFAVIVGYGIFSIRSQANHLANLTRTEAELVAAVTERAVARAMTEGRSLEVQSILEEIGDVPHLPHGIRILDLEGRVRRSSDPGEAGRLLMQGGLVPGAPGIDPIWDADGRFVQVFRRIENRPACHGCHPADRATIGYLNVSVASPQVESVESRQWTVMILSSVSALLAAGALIAVYFTIMVGRRVDAIARTMSAVETGNLSVKAPVEGTDELGRLGRSFNTMVARLAEAQRQLESRHTEEIRRAEHLAVFGKVAAGIAHEINNPLAGMQNCARTLLKGPRDEAQRIQYLELIQDGLGRIGRTVRQLLDFTREVKPQPTRTELGPILNRCVSLVEHGLSRHKIACSLALEPGLPPVLADPHQLEQVFLNILMNAVEAMPNGGALTVSTGVRWEKEGGFAEVRVTDTGAGIPAENLPRIFDPFFTTKEPGSGTGLGLSVSYGIVQAHGGSIGVETALGCGTTFAIVLPLRGD